MNKINKKQISVFLIILFTLTSCVTMVSQNMYDFSTIKDVKDLEGYYLSRVNPKSIEYKLNRGYERSILECFNINEYADFVSITFENSNEIKLTYYNDSSKQERIFKGELKKNYFEIYFSDKEFEALIMASYDIDRVRIGKSKGGSLLIKKLIDNRGHFLLLGGGGRSEESYKFSNASEYKEYMPIQKNGLWGYSDSSGNSIIPLKYDFACIFEHDVARVKLKNKWGLINKKGKEIAPLVYDKLSTIEDFYFPPIFRVFIGDKTGVLDTSGNVLIPVIYDFIDYHLVPNKLTQIRLGDKWGYATRTKVVIPAMYSVVYDSYGEEVTGIRDGKYYIADIEGYEYETRNLLLIREKLPDTKRKIQFEEQEIK